MFQKLTITSHLPPPFITSLTVDTTMSMIDGKMVDILQGDSGAPCHYCDFNTEGINNLINILAGFQITKSYDSCLDIWEKVLAGEIAWTHAERSGQCHAPLAKLKIHAVLHWKLRSFDWLLQLYYRLAW